MGPPNHEFDGGLAVRQISFDPALVTGAVAFVVLSVYALKSGGVNPTVWYPGGLLLLGLATIALVSRLRAGGARGFDPGVLGAVVALTAFAAWSVASIAWADAKGLAWDGANLTVLYLALFVLAACLPWRHVTAGALLFAYSLFVAASGVTELVRAAGSVDPTAYFQLGRFAAPFNYQNADCAWFLIGLWPALLVASRREAPVAARALATSALCVLPELALICQSRASLVALPVTAAAYLVLVPGRARTLAYGALPAAALALGAGRLLDVFPAFRDQSGIRSSLHDARNVVLVTAVLGLLVGLAIALGDRHLGARRARRVAERSILALAALAIAGSLVVLAVNLDHPIRRVTHAWHDFKSSQPPTRTSYFANGLGGNRYDIWRVALKQFESSPVTGDGVDNFAASYLKLRHTYEEPSYPHSIELRLLSETGAVGTVLFALFAGSLAIALRTLRRRSPPRRAVAGTALAMVVYWLVHGSVDWFWEMPALGGVAFACLGIAAALAAPDRLQKPSSRTTTLIAAPVAGVALLAAALSFAFPWLAAKETVNAALSWRHDPQAAYSDLDTAARLNPISDQPKLVEGAIASRLGDTARMKTAFTEALRRNPNSWYPHLELAIVASDEKQRRLALRELAQARRLNPLEQSIGFALADLRAGRELEAEEIDRAFLARIKL